MRNLTDYNDLFILDLIRQADGVPCKCTANTQYTVDGNNLIEVLCIYQDNSTGWDIEDAVLFCERVETVEFCDEKMPISDLFAMVDYYKNVSFQQNINDIEYEEECAQILTEELAREEEYYEALQKELNWYNWARQNGYE